MHIQRLNIEPIYLDDVLGLEEVRTVSCNSKVTYASCIAAGTNLEVGQCPQGANNGKCFAAFLGLHLTANSTAYREVCAILDMHYYATHYLHSTFYDKGHMGLGC